ncbi:ATP-binding cassette domain-containing protein [Haloechinothrix sp. LS1_15]|uniref:ABC transporter ATP-binding protein n=1 Tax=Haloechinothrix sp. LS1_15 TaxID=2652248 RepID=UPI002948AE71|nr:ATP-binding cassette domain-containing protein [Haloechinothrix sp. LS1_15]MDV6012513.1 ATP-binding cassette domain-containing protein [Haloechinothrix sp. LS1_15]
MSLPLLTAHDLSRSHRRRTSPLARSRVVTALDGVSLSVAQGERLGVVGESGAGKSTLARILLALERPDSGEVTAGPHERPVPFGSRRRTRWFRSMVQMIPQDPGRSLNPRIRVGDSIAEPLHCLGFAGPHRDRVAEVLHAVGLDESMAWWYPHEFSGGQRQRLAIARAIAAGPELLIADEPVSALDATSRARITELLRELSTGRGLGLLLVSHDLGVVRRLCRRVVIMQGGRIVEQGRVDELFSSPQHPYTRRLLDAVPEWT